ncbi:hypothetical protein N7468_010589 [Penicillium chermesinum]|uniref:Xylanolytic transcriptional activator regulatory domain-containing protein n=1 Tax=Penicillium chermesinum TaxID=63820 RepID=A0A9W9TAX0_9EURO|nr:uncharacterized protein N7468_010589 [Penicillium chermesinum]KAJ5214910.1 hypothetical protein N7468_010589 [Penicillium chermesinum]
MQRNPDRPPCTNCQNEAVINKGVVCEILPRKKHRPRVSRRKDGEPRNGIPSAYQSGAAESTSVEVEEEPLPDDSAHTYIGDNRGPRQSVYDLCHPRVPQEAHTSPNALTAGNISNRRTVFQPHELEYISQQGGFSWLPRNVSDALVRCYFAHVHFFLPVLEPSKFLDAYTTKENQDMNLLLLWSVFLAATNFVEADVLQQAGFSSRKAMKRAMYKRAKCFYDIDHSSDTLTLIQSVLLLSYWYSDAQEHTGASYWIGIAITLAQSIGLHRDPNTQSRNISHSQVEGKRHLTCRLWWTCVIRDRWVSLAKGRPMRIHDEDHDVKLPVMSDILNEFHTVSPEAQRQFLPPDLDKLADIWISLVKISDTLGRILRMHYRLKGPKPGVNDIDSLFHELYACQPPPLSALLDTSDIVRLHDCHIQIFHQAALTVLYRPYVLNAPASFPENSSSAWQKMVQGRARAAASTTNAFLERIIELDAVKKIKPMFITSLIPAMQIHLFDCKAGNALQANLGQNKLQLCMLILDNLRDTYWSAGVMFRLFDRAQKILLSQGNDSGPLASRNLDSPSMATPAPPPAPVGQDHVNTSPTDRVIPQFDHFPSHGAPPISLGGGMLHPNTMPGPDFNAVEQILSPGFYLSDVDTQSLLMNYSAHPADGGFPANYYDIQ